MPSSPLYAIATTDALPGRLLASVEAALRGGAAWLQYRDKRRDPARRRDEAGALRDLCQRFGAQLIINDDLALARELGVGVHLGQSDGDPREARRLLGPNALLGVTCHDSLSLARQARDAGASYVAFGRFFASSTKPDAPPAPMSLLNSARAELPTLTRVAIGGITPERGAELLRCGADRLAVSHDVFAAADIEQRARAYGALGEVQNPALHHIERNSERTGKEDTES